MTSQRVTSDPVVDLLMTRESARPTPAASMGLCFAAFLVLAALASALDPNQTVAFVLFAVVAGTIAWWSAPAWAPVIGLLAFLFLDGFAENAQGSLSWDGQGDLVRLATLVIVALVGSLCAGLKRSGAHGPVGRQEQGK